MRFLELCQAFVSEVGIGNGTGPTTVVNQVGELKKAVDWVRESNLWIDNLWKDWKYLWFEYSGVLGNEVEPQLNRFAPLPNSPPGLVVRRWDRGSFWIDKQSSQAQPLRFIPWDEFRVLHDVGRDASLPGKPNTFTILPNNRIQLFPIPALNYTITGEGWRRPPRLQLDDDLPLMPEDYHRLIVARAAIMYGNKEDAPEIISGFESEYIDLLDKLQSDQLAAFDAERQAGQDLVLEGEIPGV